MPFFMRFAKICKKSQFACIPPATYYSLFFTLDFVYRIWDISAHMSINNGTETSPKNLLKLTLIIQFKCEN